jgi:hypothetical protein
MNSFQKKSGVIEPIDDYFYLVDEQVMNTEDKLFEGDRIDDIEYVYLEKKKRRLVSKYTEKRYIP